MEAINFKPSSLEDILKENENFKYEELETYLLNSIGLLYFEETPYIHFNNFKYLLIEISCKTRGVKTLFKSNNEIQCNRVDYRSVGDLFLLAKYYRPETTIKEVYETLYEIIFEDLEKAWVCNSSKKMMYFTGITPTKNVIINNPLGEDEWGFKIGTNFIDRKNSYCGDLLYKIKDYAN